MESNQDLESGCDGAGPSNRYISFNEIDCAGNARRVMEFIQRDIAESAEAQPFWGYFMAKRTQCSGPVPDDLFLVHSHINQIREFFEQCDDIEALDLLLKLEEECC